MEFNCDDNLRFYVLTRKLNAQYLCGLQDIYFAEAA